MISKYQYRIVERHDGKFEVQKRPDNIFSFILKWKSDLSFFELENAKKHMDLLKRDDTNNRLKEIGTLVKRIVT